MQDLSIRITRRIGFGDRYQEQAIDIDVGAIERSLDGQPIQPEAGTDLHKRIAELAATIGEEGELQGRLAKELGFSEDRAGLMRLTAALVQQGWTKQRRRAPYTTERRWFWHPPKLAADTPDIVPGDAIDMQDALRAISGELRCMNTLDDILHAIDALRPAQLQWSPTLAKGKSVNYAKAEAAIAALNESLPAGEPHWRMPTRRELEAIQDLTKHDPCVDLEAYPDTKSGWYWSSTPCAWSPDYAWIVSFDIGNSLNHRRDDDDAFVRAVRAVPSGQ